MATTNDGLAAYIAIGVVNGAIVLSRSGGLRRTSAEEAVETRERNLDGILTLNTGDGLPSVRDRLLVRHSPFSPSRSTA